MSNISDQNCDDVHLYAEIDMLKQALVDKQNELIAMETTCLRETDRQAELEDSIIAWQDKYDRLYESHKRVQKVNQSLEDKLLKLVDRNSGERAQLTSDVATLSVRLAQANYNIAKLQREIERYKTDMSLAIQLLQCKPDSFVSQKVTSLPLEIQTKVAQYMRLDTHSHSDSEGSTTGVGVPTSGSYRVLPASDSPPPMCPFPPTAMVYAMRGSINSNNNHDEIASPQNDSQMISPSIIAKYLEDELKSTEIKHCDTCLCTNHDLTVMPDTDRTYNIGTQTTILGGDGINSLCLRCNSNLNSPSRTNSPYIMKLVKSSDSVISETKSSMSDSNDNDKLFTPVKKDDLMVNPILSHHRLCDRTPKVHDITTTPPVSKCLSDNIQFGDKTTANALTTQMIMCDGQHGNNKSIEMRSPEIIVSSSGSSCHNNNNIAMSIGKTNSKDSLSGGIVDIKSINKSEKNPDTVTGSTNSLWSKTSSSNTNNVEGAKIFENFNRNLIKSMRTDNPKNTGPRLCALRIQNGSSNILLDNIESPISPIVYTRRSRFLDEELDETKDVITIPSSIKNISMLMSNNNGCTNAANGGEHFYETGNLIEQQIQQQQYDKLNSSRHSSKNMLLTVTGDNHQRQVVTTSSTNIITTTTTAATAQQLEKLENETISSKNANQSLGGTQSSSISNNNELNLQECALLRLTRVAEWVQNNHMDNIVEPISSQSASSMDGAASTDSGYKTKTNNNNNNAAIMNYRSTSSSKLNNIMINDNDLIDDEINFAQNNNNLTTTSYSYNNGNNAQIDLAQMEYNVKQFLLKQNEWSIHNKVKQDHCVNGDGGGGGGGDRGDDLCESITTCVVSSSSSVPVTATKTTSTSKANMTTKYLHRTETNL